MVYAQALALAHLWGRYGAKVSFYDDVPQILHKIQSQSLKGEDSIEDSKVIIAACSRTHAPDLSVMSLLTKLLANT